jgi:hypothetical protein
VSSASLRRPALARGEIAARLLFVAVCLLWTGAAYGGAAPPLLPDTVGDGVHDDTAGIQSALDSGAAVVHLPSPPKYYLISRTLAIHSGQTLEVERNATIRLADDAQAYMLTNADHAQGDRGISVIGGIWDGNNAHHTCEYHTTHRWQVPFDPKRYLGVLMQFDNVSDLRIAHLTLKDPETFGIQAGNLRRFTIEDITFDYNLLRPNMDGVHLHGNCHQGRIANLKGATNDDLVALNADDGTMFEMSRGPITDIEVDGIWSENGYTGVRLLSGGSPISRVRISNIFGSFRYYVVSFTNYGLHAGEPSEISDVVVDGVYCAKPTQPTARPLRSDEWGRHHAPLFWVESGTHVTNLHLANILRRESLENAPPTIFVSRNATVAHLAIRDVSVTNQARTPLDFLVNDGTISLLQLANIYLEAKGGEPRGHAVVNHNSITRVQMGNCQADNLVRDGEDGWGPPEPGQ